MAKFGAWQVVVNDRRADTFRPDLAAYSMGWEASEPDFNRPESKEGFAVERRLSVGSVDTGDKTRHSHLSSAGVGHAP